jgi:YesN/AraC family two-component response regulator
MNTTLCAKCKIPINYCIPHSHSDWEIVLHISGYATVFIGDKKYTASPGDIMVIPPNTTHSNFSDDYYTDMYMQAKKLDFFDVVFTHDMDDNVLVLMNMLHKTLTEKEFHYSNIADNLTETICSYINKLSRSEHSYQFVNDLKNIIYNNFSNVDFNLTKEIEDLGYNPIYIRRCFKKVMGKPPLEYMTSLRINQAKIFLVQNTFVSIENVAHSCGFNDSFYFSTCFKKHMGIPPLQYRKQHIYK